MPERASSVCCSRSGSGGASARSTGTSTWKSPSPPIPSASRHARPPRVELPRDQPGARALARRQGALRRARRQSWRATKMRCWRPSSARPRPRRDLAGGQRVREVQVDTALERGPRQPGAVLHDHAVRWVRHRLPLLATRRRRSATCDGSPALPSCRGGASRRRANEFARRSRARARGRTAMADQVLSDSERSVPGGGIALRSDARVSRGDPARRRRVRSSMLTRSRLLERDTELLASLPAVWAGPSIPTLDDDVRRHFERPRRLDHGSFRAPCARCAQRASRRSPSCNRCCPDPSRPSPTPSPGVRLLGEHRRSICGCRTRRPISRRPPMRRSPPTTGSVSAQRLSPPRSERNGVTIWRGDLPPSLTAPEA